MRGVHFGGEFVDVQDVDIDGPLHFPSGGLQLLEVVGVALDVSDLVYFYYVRDVALFELWVVFNDGAHF